MEIDGEASSVEGHASQPASPPDRDFSRLQGFQFVGAKEDSSGGEASDDGWRAALALELDARAARFHQSVDSSIALGSDGTIRWLGDSVAKIAAGDDLLAPRTILLIDEAMSREAREIVAARLDLWLRATIQRLLGPLFSLRAVQEGPQQLKDLAVKIAEALGVLDREPVRVVVRGLDQNSRAVLRKHGVRFGSYYLYVPSTLRPACRALALQLWRLKKGDDHLGAAAQGLMPIASSGRTSAPLDAGIGPETYRVGGFRSCGDRIVRVDIVERLADMIRAASTLRLLGGAHPGAAVFEVTNQMTSLAGCSGDGFGSILRGLGFESLTVARAEIVRPAPAAPAPPASEAGLAPSGPDARLEGAVAEDAVSAGDDAPEDARDENPGAVVEDGGGGDPAALATDAPGEPPRGSADAIVGAPGAADPSAHEAADATESAGPSDALQDREEGAQPERADAGPLDAAEGPAAAPPAAGDPTAAEALAQVGPTSAEEAPVTVWRFARRPASVRRRPPHPHRRAASPKGKQAAAPQEAAQAAAGAGLGGEARGAPQAPVHEPAAVGRAAPKEGRKSGGRSGGPNSGFRAPEKRKQWGAPPAAGGGDRKAAVDPTSPFAKLLELRAILESESKKRT